MTPLRNCRERGGTRTALTYSGKAWPFNYEPWTSVSEHPPVAKIAARVAIIKVDATLTLAGAAVQLEREIQSLLTKARLKTLESKSLDRSGASTCRCNCSGCKVMCKDEICGCGLTLKECLVLTKIKENEDYGSCSK